MAKDRLGRSRGPTREEIEREAQREVERLTRRSGAPSGGGGFAAPTPLDSVAQSLGGSSMRRRPRVEPEPPSFGAPSPYDDEEPDYGYEGYDEEDDEEAAITEMALRDYAAQSGGRPEDHVVIPVDPASAEAMRDRAMSEFLERQAVREERSQPGSSKKPSDGGVLGRLAAKRAEKEARAAQGLPELEEDDEGPGGRQERGVLSRIAARRESPQAPPAFKPPGREERPRGPVYDGPVPEFVNVAARMSRSRPTPGGGPAGPVGRSSPARKAPARKAPAKTTAARKAPAKTTATRKAPVKKPGARKAPAKNAAAKKAPAKKAAKRRA